MQSEQRQLNGDPSSNKAQQAEQVLVCNEKQRLIGDELSPSRGPVPERAQVVIIGSGLAGLAAAERLHGAGVRDVVVLEAQRRVGGRVHTIDHSEFLVELGAQWLHGAQDNPLYQWLSELEMLDDFQDASLGFAGKFYTSSRCELDQKLVGRVLEVVNGSKCALLRGQASSSACNGTRWSGNTDGILSKSASEVFAEQLELAMQRDELLDTNRQLVQALFQWFLRYETIENCCDSMDEVSISSYTDWTDLGDGTLLNFRRGYSSLLAWFCAHFPANKWLYLGKQVLNVELKSDNNLLIHYRSTPPEHQDLAAGGSNAGGVIECDHVIVTASLGFLKQNLSTFFTPPLPEVKQRLIKSIGFGTVNKIILQFSEPFWQADGIKLVWSSGQDDERQEEWWRQLKAPWVRDIISFDVVRRQPNLLIGWIGGQGAKLMELEDDRRVGEICVKLLERFLPEKHAPPSRLVSCLCSRWHSNPFTRGSYSFQSMSSLHLNTDQLHEPIYSPTTGSRNSENIREPTNGLSGDMSNGVASAGVRWRREPKIMFAGEATAGKLYSTTHGAIISGWREAERLLHHLASGPKEKTLAATSFN